MICKAVEVIWIGGTGRDGLTEIKGILRGPREPKKLIRKSEQIKQLIDKNFETIKN